jgi:hypothetical protein
LTTIVVTEDDLCALVSYPFPCEEGKVIEPVAVAHYLGWTEPTASMFDLAVDEPEADSGVASKDAAFVASRTADPRLIMLSLACSMEASQAVAQARTMSSEAERAGTERVNVKNSVDAFVDGVTASPPVLTTVFPAPGSVVVVGTIVIKIPTPAPIPPHWEVGEELARTDLLALATRFQAASKMSDIGATAEDLAGAAARLIDAAIAR